MKSPKNDRVIILGAGIIGVTTAYVLASRGYRVEVIEQDSEPAKRCSFSNGGQLSYSHAEPWANPSTIYKAIKWVCKKDAPLVINFPPDMRMVKWIIPFVRNCTSRRSLSNCRTILQLSIYSRSKLHQIINDTNVEFHHLERGILHIFSKNKDFRAAISQAKLQQSISPECKEDILQYDDIVRIEPSLRNTSRRIVGGIYSRVDESGNAQLFTQELARYCREKLAVAFHYNTTIEAIEHDKKSITAIQTDKGSFVADQYIMALGAYSAIYLEKIGINLPIYPMKGYSITMDIWDSAPAMSITDDENKIVFSRLGDKIRVAGTAEFANYDENIKQSRIESLIRCTKELLPDIPTDRLEKYDSWACLRPQTPDGPPIIGKSKYDNLLLNTGHGTLGWTQCAGSAYILADILDGSTPEIDILPQLSADRYIY